MAKLLNIGRYEVCIGFSTMNKDIFRAKDGTLYVKNAKGELVKVIKNETASFAYKKDIYKTI